MQSKYYENQDMQDIVHLSQIKDISNKLNLNLIIYTLVKQNNQLIASKLFENPLLKHQPEIMLHYDPGQCHFVLIRTLVGYADVLQCPECGKIYRYNKATEFHAHCAKHKNIEKEFIFSKREIKPKLTIFEKEFGYPLKRNLYFGYDFEAMLCKEDNYVVHKPIAFVLKSSLNNVYQYVGIDSAEKFISYS